MLKYDNFKKEIMKTIGSYMPENYKNLALKEVKIDKINQTAEGFCFADENKEMTVSAVIYFKDMYSKYLSTEELYRYVKENTKRILPMRFEPLSQTMEGLIPKGISKSKDSDKAILYILSNDIITEGASYIVYKEVLNRIRKSLNSDFFISPSSINEVMILKTGINRKTYLKKVLKLINDIYIDQSDILSNNIYLYNGNLNIV
ncbi:MAG: DUF5688 family protein [Clostridiales bacterium]|nr:DUF5688 family protein [Clostridiales bacterium]